MVPADLPAVAAMAAAIHPGYPEADAVFAERLALHPAGCRLLIVAARPAGYVVSHPWRGAPPPLDTLLGAIPAAADHHYLHDLALLPVARGAGAAAVIVGNLKRHARSLRLTRLALVAVNGSGGFWQRQGFADQPAGEAAAKLASYGGDAQLMACRV
jgi:GNAT superfamily N-acetyltransferase